MKLDFVVLTPHAGRDPIRIDEDQPPVTGTEFVRRRVAALESEPPPEGTTRAPLLAIAGWEFTRQVPGHLGISFAPARPKSEVPDEKVARTALDAGGLVVVNHPFLRPVPSDSPVMQFLRADRSWAPFRDPESLERDRDWNAIEIWHDRSAFIQALHVKRASKYPDAQMVRKALTVWDRATAVQKRRITAVGGSDAHGRFPYTEAPMAMTSVLADARSEDALRRALVGARVTFGRGGGVAARTFRAVSDVKGERAGIGDALRATTNVHLTWSGSARLIENGKDVGEFDGGTTRKLPEEGAFAFWRIECKDDAYSNMIYANLPE